MHQFIPQRILIIGPAWVGDMVMAQPLFMLLKQRYPSVLIDVLAPDWSRPLLERMPEVNQAISMPIGHGELALAKRKAIAMTLKANQYDQAIVLPNSFKSALIPWWAKITKRTGWLREMRGLLLNDGRRLDKQQYPLMIERFMALALAPGETIPTPYLHPHFKVDETNIAAARHKFNLTDTHSKILALCPGAEFGPAKRWPDAYYAEVANTWLAKGWQVWLFGSKNDIPVCEQIQQATANRCVTLAGKTSLAEAIDLLSQVNAVVTNDSGLMHIAAALGRPIVAVYGSTSPGFTPPLAERVKIVRLGLDCSPCFKRECPLQHLNCLKQLQPVQVISALEQLTPS
jgi:heptosyltransferase-2